MNNFKNIPSHDKYDVVIIGGAIMGSSTAWFLSQNPDFNGTILVVEKDQKYEFCSTAHTTSCIRQQFSTKLNIEISQFAAEFINNLLKASSLISCQSFLVKSSKSKEGLN